MRNCGAHIAFDIVLVGNWQRATDWSGAERTRSETFAARLKATQLNCISPQESQSDAARSLRAADISYDTAVDHYFAFSRSDPNKDSAVRGRGMNETKERRREKREPIKMNPQLTICETVYRRHRNGGASSLTNGNGEKKKREAK